MISFNEIDKKFNCDRRSHYGPYKFIQFDIDVPILAPINPVGRTGLIGRGHLGRWGPNHAAGFVYLFFYWLSFNSNFFLLDPVVTR